MARDNCRHFLHDRLHAGWREQVLLRVLTGSIALGGFIAIALAYHLLVSPGRTSTPLIVAVYVSYFCFYPLRFLKRLSYRVRAVGFIFCSFLSSVAWIASEGLVIGPMLVGTFVVVVAGLFMGRHGLLVALLSTAAAVTLTGMYHPLHAFSGPGASELILTIIVYVAISGVMAILVEAVVRNIDDSLSQTMRANAQLASDLAERQRLEKMFLQAQKMESIGRLAGGVAHDLNNLLSVVMNYSSLIQMSLRDSDQVGYVREIQKAMERAAGLTRQLLTFARQQPVEARVFDLNQLVENFERLVRRVIGEDVDVKLSTVSTPLPVKADPNQIDQVLMNLAVNARDAMEPGDEFIVETQAATLDETNAESHPDVGAGNYALLIASDTGMGMPEAVREQIFEPFYTTKEQGKGTGLGLATCYGIVKQCGGSIWVYTKVGQGTTFKIYLPLADEAVTPCEQTEDGTLPQGNETVLLVEDESQVRHLVKTVLSQRGYHVLEAANGEQAIKIANAAEGEVDLLLTDVVMPRMGGKELTDHLRRIRPGLRVLFMSGYAESVIVHNGVIEPGVSLLQKPFTASVLATRVRRELDTETVHASTHSTP